MQAPTRHLDHILDPAAVCRSHLKLRQDNRRIGMHRHKRRRLRRRSCLIRFKYRIRCVRRRRRLAPSLPLSVMKLQWQRIRMDLRRILLGIPVRGGDRQGRADHQFRRSSRRPVGEVHRGHVREASQCRCPVVPRSRKPRWDRAIPHQPVTPLPRVLVQIIKTVEHRPGFIDDDQRIGKVVEKPPGTVASGINQVPGKEGKGRKERPTLKVTNLPVPLLAHLRPKRVAVQRVQHGSSSSTVPQRELRRRRQLEHLQRPGRPLGHRVEHAQAFDLVAEELQAHRPFRQWRKEIEDATATTE